MALGEVQILQSTTLSHHPTKLLEKTIKNNNNDLAGHDDTRMKISIVSALSFISTCYPEQFMSGLATKHPKKFNSSL